MLRLVEVIRYFTDTIELRQCETKQKTLCLLDVRRLISTKLCMMVEEVHDIILPMVFGFRQ